MAAEINELFEQGITCCGELGDAVDSAMDAIDDAADRARDLAERVVKEGTDAAQRLRDLASRVQQAARAAEDGGREARSLLAGTASGAGDLRSVVGSFLERVKNATDPLARQRSRLDDSLEAHMAGAQAAFSDLAGRTQELESEAGGRTEQADAAIAALRRAIDTARADLVEKKGAWTAVLDASRAVPRSARAPGSPASEPRFKDRPPPW